MAARFAAVDIIACGQSQAIMAFTGSGETVDGGIVGTGGAWLLSRLQQLQSGVAFSVVGSSANTLAADTPLFQEFVGTASATFFDGSPFAPRARGTLQLDFINSRAAPTKMGVVVFYQHAQDVAAGTWSSANYATFSAAYVDRLISDAVAAGWGEFYVLPVLSSSRGSGTNEALAAYRRTWAALSGHDDWQGLARRPQVLRPVEMSNSLDIDRWSNISADRTHVVASTARRTMDIIALRVAGLNGATVPMAEQPRLYRAVRVNATTVRAFVSLGQRGATLRHNPVSPATARFALLGGGSISAVTGPDNTNAAAGYATFDLTVSGLTVDSRLAYAINFAASEFENGDTPPRGELRNAAWSIAQGTTLANPVTDDAQDAKLPAGEYALAIANNNRGVAIEEA